MFKKLVLFFLCVAMAFAMVACNNDQSGVTTEPSGDTVINNDVVSLTEDEKAILEAMGSDVNVVTDDAYVTTIAELMYHTHDYIGSVYQIEGVLSANGDVMNVSRTLVNGDETESCGLPLRYLEKDIEVGAWIRVTGVIAESEINGEVVTVLDIVAIETLAQAGQAEIQWDGEPIHQH